MPADALVIEPGYGGSAATAFIWAYRTPSGADFHRQRPPTLNGQEFVGETAVAGQLTRLERSELVGWARRYRASWDVMRSGADGQVESSGSSGD